MDGQRQKKKRDDVRSHPTNAGGMSVFLNGTALPRSPLDSFLLLRGVFPPVDEVAMSQSHDRGSAGWLRLPPLLCQWPPLGPPPRGHPSRQSSGTPMRGSRWTDLCLGAVPGPNHGDFPHTLFSLALFRRIQSASTGPSCQRPLRPFAAARKRLEHTAYTIRTVKREPPPSGQPKESALASATGQGD